MESKIEEVHSRITSKLSVRDALTKDLERKSLPEKSDKSQTNSTILRSMERD